MKDFEINITPFCVTDISKACSVDNNKKPGLYGYVCNFSVDYDSIDIDDNLDFHKYFMK